MIGDRCTSLKSIARREVITSSPVARDHSLPLVPPGRTPVNQSRANIDSGKYFGKEPCCSKSTSIEGALADICCGRCEIHDGSLPPSTIVQEKARSSHKTLGAKKVFAGVSRVVQVLNNMSTNPPKKNDKTRSNILM